MDETLPAKDYYEQPELWGHTHGMGTEEQERIDRTLSLVPEESRSVLDVGCGDGRIVNRLAGQHARVCGIDTSREALQHVVAGARCLASIDRLPFRDKSFELVICCEVLEHLPVHTYSAALKEIQRTAAKQVLVTVPNAEDLRQQLVACPSCHCRFNPHRHLRSYYRNQMHNLLDSFELVSLQFSGEVKAYPGLMVDLARLLRSSASAFPPTAICPQCGYSRAQSAGDSATAGSVPHVFRDRSFRLLRFIARKLIPRRKRHIWLLALYRIKAHKE